MLWVEVFAVLVVCHLAGDFVLQTEWQARNKIGGLGRHRPEARRALVSHVATYTLCFVPGLVWLADSLGWGILWVAVAVALPHLIQDDGRLLTAYLRRVKGSRSQPGELVYLAADQSLHVLVLFIVALAAG
jgi:Protein of unknown function (DUF3307)